MSIIEIAIAKALSGGGGSGGTTDYSQMSNKPKINNVELSGNKSLADLGAVDDVQINGTSIVDANGAAVIPLADIPAGTNAGKLGLIALKRGRGIVLNNNDHSIYLEYATQSQAKSGTNTFVSVTVGSQHWAAFYGLAKAAGHDEKDSTLAFGTYTEEAKNAIRAMLGVTDSAGGMNIVTLTGTNITQTAAENTMYKCGELAELTFTAPASGITAVRFSSGSTPTVASFPGVTWLGDFDPDNLLSNVTYEINILDGVGVAGWA